MSRDALWPTYAPSPTTFTHGQGSYLYTEGGAAYLDFASGIAVSSLGHAHPKLVQTLKEAAEGVWHLSNVYRVPAQERLAEKLAGLSFADACFFCNSGAEAVEASIKAARRYHYDRGDSERVNIVGMTRAFHGRTYGGINAAGQPPYREGFGPPMPGFVHVAPGDHDALEKAVDKTTAAVILEPILGEGGILPVPEQCLKGLRELCDRHGALLILDEVQSGMGRTGRLFAHEWAGIEPDIMAIAKGLGGGFPVGACLSKQAIADVMVKGTHGSTFGGGPIASAIAEVVVDEVSKPEFLEHVRRVGDVLREELGKLATARSDVFAGLRGKGLMWGLPVHTPGMEVDIMKAAMERGLLVLKAGGATVRILPPLVLTEAEACEGVRILGEAVEAAFPREQALAAE
jgi:acetylornithine/N-succinyldiaminopimelate aminotransferase